MKHGTRLYDERLAWCWSVALTHLIDKDPDHHLIPAYENKIAHYTKLANL